MKYNREIKKYKNWKNLPFPCAAITEYLFGLIIPIA